MPTTKLTHDESGWVAFDNEREASAWALRSMHEHVRRIEEELSIVRHARGLAETRAILLERELLARETPTSGVRKTVRKV